MLKKYFSFFFFLFSFFCGYGQTYPSFWLSASIVNLHMVKIVYKNTYPNSKSVFIQRSFDNKEFKTILTVPNPSRREFEYLDNIDMQPVYYRIFYMNNRLDSFYTKAKRAVVFDSLTDITSISNNELYDQSNDHHLVQGSPSSLVNDNKNVSMNQAQLGQNNESTDALYSNHAGIQNEIKQKIESVFKKFYLNFLNDPDSAFQYMIQLLPYNFIVLSYVNLFRNCNAIVLEYANKRDGDFKTVSHLPIKMFYSFYFQDQSKNFLKDKGYYRMRYSLENGHSIFTNITEVGGLDMHSTIIGNVKDKSSGDEMNSNEIENEHPTIFKDTSTLVRSNGKLDFEAFLLPSHQLKLLYNNPYYKSTLQMNIQQSNDSLIGFKTIYSIYNPSQLVDSIYLNLLYNFGYFRIYYVLNNNSFYLSQAKKIVMVPLEEHYMTEVTPLQDLSHIASHSSQQSELNDNAILSNGQVEEDTLINQSNLSISIRVPNHSLGIQNKVQNRSENELDWNAYLISATNQVVIQGVQNIDGLDHIEIQRSFDSVIGFRTIYNIANNHHVFYYKSNLPFDHIYYRIAYILKSGETKTTIAKTLIYINKLSDIPRISYVEPSSSELSHISYNDSYIKPIKSINTIVLFNKRRLYMYHRSTHLTKQQLLSFAVQPLSDKIKKRVDSLFLITPLLDVQEHYSPFVLTDDTGVIIQLPFQVKPYQDFSINFYNAKGHLMFRFPITAEKVVIGMSNFMHQGWFYFEILLNHHIIDKNKIYVSIAS